MSKKGNTLRDIGERGLIRWFQDLITPYDKALLSGLEDAVAVPFNEDALVVNSDMLVESTDVLPGMTASEIAWKAGVMGLSDLAAKGATPLGVLISLGLPAEAEANFAAALVGGLNCVCREHETYYLGGDTNQCLELVIDCTAIGRVPQNQLMRRKGAKPGDLAGPTSVSLSRRRTGQHRAAPAKDRLPARRAKPDRNPSRNRAVHPPCR